MSIIQNYSNWSLKKILDVIMEEGAYRFLVIDVEEVFEYLPQLIQDVLLYYRDRDLVQDLILKLTIPAQNIRRQ